MEDLVGDNKFLVDRKKSYTDLGVYRRDQKLKQKKTNTEKQHLVKFKI